MFNFVEPAYSLHSKWLPDSASSAMLSTSACAHSFICLIICQNLNFWRTNVYYIKKKARKNQHKSSRLVLSIPKDSASKDRSLIMNLKIEHHSGNSKGPERGAKAKMSGHFSLIFFPRSFLNFIAFSSTFPFARCDDLYSYQSYFGSTERWRNSISQNPPLVSLPDEHHFRHQWTFPRKVLCAK